MGDKVVARATVLTAGVPVVPGTEGVGNLSDEDLLDIAPRIGFPLLVKATAGGGGKGMREVSSLAEMPELLSTARREAESSFGDGNVYLEKLVEGARHIEIQILADTQGNVLHLNERECSIQRRHQKLIEESPSPFVGDDEDFRQQMGSIAVKAAQAVEYVNAGTIEFLVDKDRHIYFLEMNTRLQVEHAVTEEVTCLDIVAEQLRVAGGEALGWRQGDIAARGAAIECRVYAEDPNRGFLPSPGIIRRLDLPGGEGVRVESGVEVGSAVSVHYDPLLFKLVVRGDSRDEAIALMAASLDRCRVEGVKTNLGFLGRVVASEAFRRGQVHTQRGAQGAFSA
jgi:acetyl/propionyl-CoA carboxylase alpha subunit